MLRLLDHSFAQPAMNLACDEALLDGVNRGLTEPTLRIWESPTPFVVLGTGQAAAAAAHLQHCQQDRIPVLRRCTAGGCVLQGPGSLNFTLALDYKNFPEVRNLHDSYCWVLKRLAQQLAAIGAPATLEGVCDLALDGRKISGNAQRRSRNAILHHGTLLYAFDPEAMARYLPMPAERPEYRGQRDHRDFLAALPFSSAQLRAVMAAAFPASPRPAALTPREHQATARLARVKYEDPAWNLRR